MPTLFTNRQQLVDRVLDIMTSSKTVSRDEAVSLLKDILLPYKEEIRKLNDSNHEYTEKENIRFAERCRTYPGNDGWLRR